MMQVTTCQCVESLSSSCPVFPRPVLSRPTCIFYQSSPSVGFFLSGSLLLSFELWFSSLSERETVTLSVGQCNVSLVSWLLSGFLPAITRSSCHPHEASRVRSLLDSSVSKKTLGICHFSLKKQFLFCFLLSTHMYLETWPPLRSFTNAPD